MRHQVMLVLIVQPIVDSDDHGEDGDECGMDRGAGPGIDWGMRLVGVWTPGRCCPIKGKGWHHAMRHLAPPLA
jgi:hypothetical protein